MGCEDRYGVRSDSWHENHEHLTSAGGQNHQRDLEIAYLILSVPGSFKHSESKGENTNSAEQKAFPQSTVEGEIETLPCGPDKQQDGSK